MREKAREELSLNLSPISKDQLNTLLKNYKDNLYGTSQSEGNDGPEINMKIEDQSLLETSAQKNPESDDKND